MVNDRYLHRRPIVFTTNKPLEAWGKVLHDQDLAEANLDRVLERGRVLQLKGPSYRTKHLNLQSKQGAIISGKKRPEFPEPTRQTALPRRTVGSAAATPARNASIVWPARESRARGRCTSATWGLASSRLWATFGPMCFSVLPAVQCPWSRGVRRGRLRCFWPSHVWQAAVLLHPRRPPHRLRSRNP
ncbi:MAG: ATP-binding protein [Thermoplasmatota archaeon]